MQHNVLWLECAQWCICVTYFMCVKGLLWCLFALCLCLSAVVFIWLLSQYIQSSWSKCRFGTQGTLLSTPPAMSTHRPPPKLPQVCSTYPGPATGKVFIADTGTIRTYIPRIVMDHGQTGAKPIHSGGVSYVSTAQNGSSFQMPWARYQPRDLSRSYV